MLQPSRRPVAMCMCVEAQVAEAVLAAAEQWMRRLVQVVHGARHARGAPQSELGIMEIKLCDAPTNADVFVGV